MLIPTFREAFTSESQKRIRVSAIARNRPINLSPVLCTTSQYYLPLENE